MTDTQQEPLIAQPTPAPVAAQPNTFGLVALILGGVGFLLAVIPPTSGLAWLLLIPATVLAIIALTRKGQKKGLALAAVIIAPIGWILSLIVFSVTALVGISAAFENAGGAPSVSTVEGSEASDEAVAAGIGDTVTSSDGVAFTVSGVTCGLASAGESFYEEAAKGQFCEVQLLLANGTDESLNVSSWDFKAHIGEAEYESDSIANKFGEDTFGTDVNPGLSTTATIYFDVPVGAALDTVQYEALLSFDDALVVAVS